MDFIERIEDLFKNIQHWFDHIGNIIWDVLGIVFILLLSCGLSAFPAAYTYNKLRLNLSPIADGLWIIVLILSFTFLITSIAMNTLFTLYRRIPFVKTNIDAMDTAIKLTDYALNFIITILFTTIIGIMPVIYNYLEVFVSDDKGFLFQERLKYTFVIYFILSMSAILKLCLQRELKQITTNKQYSKQLAHNQ